MGAEPEREHESDSVHEIYGNISHYEIRQSS